MYEPNIDILWTPVLDGFQTRNVYVKENVAEFPQAGNWNLEWKE